MRFTKPVFLSFLAAISMTAFVFFLVYYYNNGLLPTDRLGISLVIFFIVAFLFLLFFLNRFVFKKIVTLYENIHKLRTLEESLPEKKKLSYDVLNDLNREVMDWSEERKNEIERLNKLEQYRRDFLGNVSHELKTPIFNIQGYVSTLLDGGIADPEINKKYLSKAEKSVDRMISIVEDLEAITQLETGELQLDHERFDIVPLVKDVFEAQEMKASVKKISLLLKDSSEKPVWVLADRFRIRQVLINLVVNSVKYGREGGQTEIRFNDTGENILVEVADTGIGIPKEHIPRLFERFYRVDKSRSREQGGTGLGLAIVKHIIEAHRQNLNVMSTEGIGSVFSFTLRKG